MRTYDVYAQVTGLHRFSCQSEDEIEDIFESTDYGRLEDASYEISGIDEGENNDLDVRLDVTGRYYLNVSEEFEEELHNKINEIIEEEDFGPIEDMKYDVYSVEDVTLETMADIYYDYDR